MKADKLSRQFTLTEGCNREEPIFKDMMEKDLKGMNTPLELMKHYSDLIGAGTSYGSIDEKLNALFLCGRTPEAMDGYYHGITLGLKTGADCFRLLESIRDKLNLGKGVDPLQIFYGTLLAKTSPWAGKNFRQIDAARLGELTGGFDTAAESACLGINSFRKDNRNFVNNLSGLVLSGIIEMEGVPGPESEQRSWIHAKGGLFLAGKEMSVDPDCPGKEVLALNYRWGSLGNRFPNKLLIDELVEIATGLFLGKLYYATALDHLFRVYDPKTKASDYKYRGFGYFLLMDDTWLREKNTLFPELAYELDDNLPEKLRSFHFVDSAECRSAGGGIKEGTTILHLLQNLSRGVEEGKDSEEKYFQELHRLFMCGQRPDGIQGFLHGGVVAFKSSGLLAKLEKNVLNDLWPAVRPFSPWTGKTFTNVPLPGIEKYIGSDSAWYERREPLILGTNTYRKNLGLSLPVTLLIENLDKLGMFVEYPSESEKDEDVYVKSFYFIASMDESLSPACKGREVLRFNYRWKGLRTISPDNLCMDELVRIAEGLYLGQLLYSTRPDIEYDPERDPKDYEYENFGYFMLMDDEWYAIKEFITFDTEQ